MNRLLPSQFDLTLIDESVRRLQSVVESQLIIRYIYYAVLMLGIESIVFQSNILNKVNYHPFPTIFWAQYVSLSDAVRIIQVSFIGIALLGCFLYKKRIVRILIFLVILQLQGLLSSFGDIHHQWYFLLFISFLFIFLPGENESELAKKKNLLLVWAAQAFILLTYSMAGLGKIFGIFEQMTRGEIHGLMPQAMALHIAHNANTYQIETLFGAFFIENYVFGWPLFIGSIYLELFAFYVVFHPSLHRVWAIALIVMHVAIYFTLGVVFIPTIILLIILFFQTPFHEEWNLKETLNDLPLFGWIFRSILSKI